MAIRDANTVSSMGWARHGDANAGDRTDVGWAERPSRASVETRPLGARAPMRFRPGRPIDMSYWGWMAALLY